MSKDNHLGKDLIRQKSFRFAVRVVNLSQYLQSERKEFVMSKQVLRSGTSIGANIAEARGTSSNRDFAHKFSISYRESHETKFWLQLLKETDYIDLSLFNSLFNDCEELSKLLFRSIKTART